MLVVRSNLPTHSARARAAGKRFRAGVVLYDGEASLGFGDGLFAVPLRALAAGPGA